MALTASTASDIDGRNLFNHFDNLRSASIPYLFHGRDFSWRNDFYLQKIFEFHESYWRFPDINPNPKAEDADICSCPSFIKCSYIKVHQPRILTSEFAQETWIKSLANDNKINLWVKNNKIRAGNTSIAFACELIYNNLNTNIDYPLISNVSLSCHVDLETKRPIPICNMKRNSVQKGILKKSEEELKRLNELYDLFRINMDNMNVMVEENKHCLFECKLQIQYTDIDHNAHVNQAVYGKYIENALFEYCEGYLNGKYHISDVTVNYIHEMKVRRNTIKGLQYCLVKIVYDKNIDARNERNIAGIIQQNDTLCLQFKLTLIPYKHERLFALRSKM